MPPILHKAILRDEEIIEIGGGFSKHNPSLLEMPEYSRKSEEEHEADRDPVPCSFYSGK